MDNQTSSLESNSALCALICSYWADVYYYSDYNLIYFLDTEVINLIKSMPESATTETIIAVTNINRITEEIEFLIELIEASCRHNHYILNDDLAALINKKRAH